MNVQQEGKKHKKRINTKYSLWFGRDMVRKSDLPQRCYNHRCKHHSIHCYDDCKHKKCRFKNSRFKPGWNNDFWEEKYDEDFDLKSDIWEKFKI